MKQREIKQHNDAIWSLALLGMVDLKSSSLTFWLTRRRPVEHVRRLTTAQYPAESPRQGLNTSSKRINDRQVKRSLMNLQRASKTRANPNHANRRTPYHPRVKKKMMMEKDGEIRLCPFSEVHSAQFLSFVHFPCSSSIPRQNFTAS